MSYDPREHAVAGRHVAAGWIVCVVVIGLALGLTTKHEPGPEAASAATLHTATTAGADPLSGARIPRFVHCCSRLDKRLFAIAEARPKARSTPIGGCG